MKKYSTIGELLLDYRAINGLTKLDLAEKFDIDVRTINRWEKNQTLLKPEKEAEMVDITFIPYQLIRNLNAPVPIPTYYDFSLRKYSVSELSKDLPHVDWLGSIDILSTERIRTISSDAELDLILRSTMNQPEINKKISKDILLRAIELLPEINLIIYDVSGFYSGHSIYFPLRNETYQKIRSREITEFDITLDDLVDFRTVENPVFYLFDMSADCNDNLFFIFGSLNVFFKETLSSNYVTASFTSRSDSFSINEQLGSIIVWEDKEMQKELNSKAVPRLYETKFILEQ
ncbi:MAG: helix-turn-helix transcriptional regulator [Flavobacteriales bacterium]|nr:helix-turn-helix transcriptional regulator [Flavobacteriales bacterium]